MKITEALASVIQRLFTKCLQRTGRCSGCRGSSGGRRVPCPYRAYFHLNEREKRVYKMAKIISGPDKVNEERKAMRQRVMEGAL